MPQVFQVLKCYKCLVFQIHQTKKSNKFECKMCGEKQSIKRHYGIGTGKDCRIHVQKLNALRGNMEGKCTTAQNSDEEYEDEIHVEVSINTENSECNPAKRSKWSTFIDKDEEVETVEEPMFLGDREVLLEFPQKTKTRKFKVKPKAPSDEYSMNNSVRDEIRLKAELSSSSSSINIHNMESEILLPVQHNSPQNINSACKKELTSKSYNSIAKNSDQPVLQKNNMNSKWAQYVESEDNSDVLTNQDSEQSVSDNLFSLCDDNDLDKLLDI